MTSSIANGQRVLGITVLGDYIVSEGPHAVIENVLRAGATAVACNPTVTAPGNETNGTWQPPSDAGHSPRTFDRELFGQQALWLRSGVSFRPRAELYRDSPYGPRKTNDLTDELGPLIGEFVERAAQAGLDVYLQIGAMQPSGLRDEDRPRMPNGQLPAGRIADVASLASEATRAYNRSYVADLLAEYPSIKGFRIDWPEYPCYTPDEVFQDFSGHVAAWAGKRGIDFDSIKHGVQAFREKASALLCNDLLREFCDPHEGAIRFGEWIDGFAGVAQWLSLKSELSLDVLRHWREIVKQQGGPQRQLVAQTFMPPFTQITGFDFASAADLCDGISPKLYTMHWCLMLNVWGTFILAGNSALDESLLTAALLKLLQLEAERTRDGDAWRLDDFAYPAPDQPHPVSDACQEDKIAQVQQATGRPELVTPIVHGYGPPADFGRRFALAARSAAAGVWINRYGYLGDEKLAMVQRLWN